MADEEQAAAQDDKNRPIIQPQKIYIKDLSFESPNSPDAFTKDWEPKLGFEFESQTRELPENAYEVVVIAMVTVSVSEKTAYLAEIHQAGIFTMMGLDARELLHAQSVFCLQLLYPYASAALGDLVSKGGFPQLILPPINFEAHFQKNIKAGSETADPTAMQHQQE